MGRLLEVRFRGVTWRGNLCRRLVVFVLNGVEAGELNGISRECFSSYTLMFPSISSAIKETTVSTTFRFEKPETVSKAVKK